MIPRPIAYLAQESNSPTQIRRAINAGFKTVALQLRVVTADAVKTARDAGLFVAVWDVAGAATKLPAGAQAFIPQVESPSQRDGALAAFAAGVGAGLERAIVTTYSGLEQGQWAAFAKAGVNDCHVECYADDGFPHADLNRMLGQGEIYGIPKQALMAVVGTYRGETPDVYAGLAERVPDYGIYIVEQTSDAQLALYRDLIAPAPVVPDPAPINAEINELAHLWLDPHEGDDALARLRSIARITKTSDAQWVNARARIIAALDSVGAPQG